MAMKMSSSQSEVKIEIMLEQRRPIMSAALFSAVMKGDADVLIRCLRLSEESKVKVQVEVSDPAPKQTETEQQNVQAELQSATCLGDTILHLLVTNGHNELAQKVFQKDMSLLKAQNKKLETPLHCAAKVGNEEFIQSLIELNSGVVKDALGVTNDNEDTALHVAAKYCQEFVGRELVKLDPAVIYKVNKDGSSPFHIAIDDGCTGVVKIMLEVDPTLVYTQLSDGTFPVHVAARMGNTELLMHFLEQYPDSVVLRDQHGRNLFHIAAAENKDDVFVGEKGWRTNKMLESMINAKDYAGNTPFHIAATEGHRATMEALWRRSRTYSAEANNKGQTPFDLSVIQQASKDKDIGAKINIYIRNYGRKFTLSWFYNLMDLSSRLNIADKTQVIGLGSVLITTVAFAAAFTFPGGYKADNGTPILGRRYMFRAFTLANALAFGEAFVSICLLIWNVLFFGDDRLVASAAVYFMGAASSMVVTFGIGSYLMLAPVSMPIAIIILVLSLLFGSYTLLAGLAEVPSWNNIAIIILVFICPFLFIFVLALAKFAAYTFLFSASSMVVAFGLGLYVTLAPNDIAIAIFILVITLFLGYPAMHFVILAGKELSGF